MTLTPRDQAILICSAMATKPRPFWDEVTDALDVCVADVVLANRAWNFAATARGYSAPALCVRDAIEGARMCWAEAEVLLITGGSEVTDKRLTCQVYAASGGLVTRIRCALFFSLCH